MTTQAFLLFTDSDVAAVNEVNALDTGVAVIPRQIDNPLANNLGEGVVVGVYSVAPARLLNDPEYTAYLEVCGSLPIRVWDSDVLFLPDVI